MNRTLQVPEAKTAFMSALVVLCECGRAGCDERVTATERQLARARRQGKVLVSHSHLSQLSSLAEVVGVADSFVVLRGRPGKEQSS